MPLRSAGGSPDPKHISTSFAERQAELLAQPPRETSAAFYAAFSVHAGDFP